MPRLFELVSEDFTSTVDLDKVCSVEKSEEQSYKDPNKVYYNLDIWTVKMDRLTYSDRATRDGWYSKIISAWKGE